MLIKLLSFECIIFKDSVKDEHHFEQGLCLGLLTIVSPPECKATFIQILQLEQSSIKPHFTIFIWCFLKIKDAYNKNKYTDGFLTLSYSNSYSLYVLVVWKKNIMKIF